MLVGPMKKRIALAGVAGFLIMFLITVVLSFFGYQLYSAKNKELEELKGSKKQVYTLKRDIAFTNEIGVGDFELRQIDEGAVPNGAIRNIEQLKNVLGEKAFARIDLKSGTVLTDAMVYKDEKIEKDVREQELNMVLLPSQLDEGDYVDIRFLLPNGSDYVVISKTKVVKTTQQSIWLNLNEVERLRVSSAIIESYLTEGSLLYAIEYSDAPQQEEAQITYDVLTSVMAVLEVTPNIPNLIERNNEIKLDGNYQIRREMFNSYVEPYLVKNTGDEPNKINETLNEKISERIKIQQAEREQKLANDAAAIQAAQAQQQVNR